MTRLGDKKIEISAKLAKSSKSYWLGQLTETILSPLGLKSPRQRAALGTFSPNFDFKIVYFSTWFAIT